MFRRQLLNKYVIRVLGAAALFGGAVFTTAFMMPHPTSFFTAKEAPISDGEMRTHALMSTPSVTAKSENEETDPQQQQKDKEKDQATFLPNSEGKKVFQCTSTLTLPFSSEVAFDAFADLPRQPSWSSFLKSVEYVKNDAENGAIESEWTMSFMRMEYSWRSVNTRLSRPHIIEWIATSGLQNGGRVTFEPIPEDKNKCLMTMTMSIIPPRPVSMLIPRPSKLEKLIQVKILDSTLAGFRDVVLEEDLSNEYKRVRGNLEE